MLSFSFSVEVFQLATFDSKLEIRLLADPLPLNAAQTLLPSLEFEDMIPRTFVQKQSIILA
jgi:hypothetical protein